jgi:hypothetical protein
MIDLWPYLMPVFLGGLVTCIGYIYNLKTEVAVLKKTLENLTATVGDMRTRIDSHSKKNDEVVNLITSFKIEVIQKIGAMATDISKLSSDVENINRSFLVFDTGIKTKKK